MIGAPLGINLSKYYENKSNPIWFSLIAVIDHHGKSINEGHYTCKVKKGEEWFSCDDHEVIPTQVSFNLIKFI